MAAITPSAGNGSARNLVRMDTTGAAPAAGRYKNLAGLAHQAYFFSNIDNNDDFTLPRGVVACAWQANTIDDQVAVTVSSDTSIRASTAATDPDGWIHVLTAGTLDLTGTNDETPVAKGTAGYTAPGRIFRNEKAAAPVTVTNGRAVGSERFRLQVFPFTLGSTSDSWAATTGGLCPGIVAVAWQAETTGDDVAVTLDAAGDVIFTAPTGDETGYLWVWRAR